jgi:N-acetyl-1-D-myo-inositol-2-amino-2-deoxy-alpha-D-glucopyranoside deacetylase
VATGEPDCAARRLLLVHAHPDDESITTGGLIARSDQLGIRTCLVTCTDGRYGPVNPELGLHLDPEGLAGVRSKELEAAAKVLMISEVEELGYHDSGMTGADTNHAPRAFWSQPPDVMIGRLCAVIRRFRPHVLVTYDPFGGTGHPDHVQAHRIAILAIEAAAEERAFPDCGPAWVVSQVLYPVFPISAMDQFISEEIRDGRPHPMEGKSLKEINYLRADTSVTHTVDIRAVYDAKRDALHSHRTQVGPHYPQMYRAALARREREHFRLAVDHVGDIDFSDLFEPVAR